MRALSIFVLLLTGFAANAQAVRECDWVASAWNLQEPWEEATQTFANGAVRIAILDTIEPAAAAFHLLVLSPPYNEVGDRQCRLVSGNESGLGFSGLQLEGMLTGYDPETGLGLTLKAQIYDPQIDDYRAVSLWVAINQATGVITAEIE